MNRRDLYSECANPGTPIDVLKEAWCSRCGNPECVRSVVGLSKFEDRIKDWEKKLFTEAPQLSPEDPRFSLIIGKRFITLDVTGRTPEIRSDWVDPRDLKEPEMVPAPPAPLVVTPVTPLPAPDVIAPPTAAAPPTTPPKPTVSQPSADRVHLVGANAPNQSGKILPGAPGGSTNEVDPWAAPEPPQPADQVVKPGAKIKMGGGSGV